MITARHYRGHALTSPADAWRTQPCALTWRDGAVIAWTVVGMWVVVGIVYAVFGMQVAWE